MSASNQRRDDLTNGQISIIHSRPRALAPPPPSRRDDKGYLVLVTPHDEPFRLQKAILQNISYLGNHSTDCSKSSPVIVYDKIHALNGLVKAVNELLTVWAAIWAAKTPFFTKHVICQKLLNQLQQNLTS